jgi:hypothetical protein
VGINTAGQIVFNTNNGVYVVTPLTPVATPVTVTINSAPPGLSFTSEGSTYTTPHSFEWSSGSTHRVSFVSVIQSASARKGFAGWADGDKNATREITVPAAAMTYTANYANQYQLQLQVSPAIGGITAANPPSTDGFYNAGTTVQVTAIANSAYKFTTFSGDLLGSSPSQALVMSAPRSVTANFDPVQNPALAIRIVNDVSKAAQPGPNVTVAIRLTNNGQGVANDVQLTNIAARILAPAPGTATVNKTMPVLIGSLPAGVTSGTVYVPMVVPNTARRTVIQIEGSTRNSAGRLFTFSSSATIIR